MSWPSAASGPARPRSWHPGERADSRPRYADGAALNDRSALVRLLILAAAWAAGSTAMAALQLRGLRDLAGFALAAGAYWLTRGLGGRRRRGELKYWRGRPVDDR